VWVFHTLRVHTWVGHWQQTSWQQLFEQHLLGQHWFLQVHGSKQHSQQELQHGSHDFRKWKSGPRLQ
jgi:hypothetical protein